MKPISVVFIRWQENSVVYACQGNFKTLKLKCQNKNKAHRHNRTSTPFSKVSLCSSVCLIKWAAILKGNSNPPIQRFPSYITVSEDICPPVEHWGIRITQHVLLHTSGTSWTTPCRSRVALAFIAASVYGFAVKAFLWARVRIPPIITKFCTAHITAANGPLADVYHVILLYIAAQGITGASDFSPMVYWG